MLLKGLDLLSLLLNDIDVLWRLGDYLGARHHLGRLLGNHLLLRNRIWLHDDGRLRDLLLLLRDLLKLLVLHKECLLLRKHHGCWPLYHRGLLLLLRNHLVGVPGHGRPWLCLNLLLRKAGHGAQGGGLHD